ncbi:D-alanyl-D-alanine carboxypeptidase [Dissulfurimicrobium hydrothermale]|nr:D-alanyl-D-alanine carboxypeptidase [Dissulfurimicrobium hydrothermale]
MQENPRCSNRGVGGFFHVFWWGIVTACCCLVGHGLAFAYEPYVSAKAAVVMDAESGEILYAKNPYLKLPPASTTKIVTTLVALDHLKLNDTAVADYIAAGVEPSKLGLHPGDRMTVKDLLYSVMLKSANDASVVVAERVAGSVKRFAEMMNEKAGELGAVDTHFSNPNGLPAPNHYTTAYDLAVMFDKAEENPIFAKITKTKFTSVKIVRPSGRSKKLYIQNHNKLLWSFEGTEGGKTGYTREAMHCFAGMVKYGDRKLVVSMLGSKDNWEDVRRLLNYGFASLQHDQKSIDVAFERNKPIKHAIRIKHAIHKKRILIAKNKLKKQSKKRNITKKEFKTYTIQVAAFKKAVNAKKLKKYLAKDGFNTTLKNRDNLYRVVIKEQGTPRKIKHILTIVENKYDVKPMLLN